MRILLLGFGPLPFENEPRNLAIGKRTWQFAWPMHKVGHEVLLLCGRQIHSYSNEERRPPIEEAGFQGLRYLRVRQDLFLNPEWVRERVIAFRPEAVVGATTVPSALAARMGKFAPVWADVMGDPMAEAQTKSHAYRNDGYLLDFGAPLLTVLDKANAFSAVSGPQRHALIGQLGIRGRLTGTSSGYEWVSTIPCAFTPDEHSLTPTQSTGPDWEAIPPEAFCLLWNGGFNTWSNPYLFFKATQQAMEITPSLHVVVSGGALKGHDILSFQRLLDEVEHSPFRDRFHFLGWIDSSAVRAVAERCQAAVCVDSASYETELGSRSRIVEWLHWRLPVVTSLGTELAWTLHEHNLALTFENKDSQALADILASLPDRSEELQAMADRAYHYAEKHFSYEATTAPLLEWLDLVERNWIDFKCLGRFPLDAPGARLRVRHRWSVVRQHWEEEGAQTTLKKIGRKILKSLHLW